jgi:predicted DNA-binding protein YlxM (UPF0122 family)
MLTKLPAKYQKALHLIAEGELSLGQIAAKCGINRDVFYDLIEGNESKYGKTGKLFNEEYRKIEKQIDRDIKKLTRKNKKSVQWTLEKWLSTLQQAPKRVVNDRQTIALVTRVGMMLAKSTPNVEIGQFHYTKGLSAEDLLNEFKRLKGLSSDGGGVPQPQKGRTREIFRSSESGSAVAEESEDSILPAESED